MNWQFIRIVRDKEVDLFCFQRVVHCVVVSVKTIWNIILLTFVVEFIFAVIGVRVKMNTLNFTHIFYSMRCTNYFVMASFTAIQGPFFALHGRFHRNGRRMPVCPHVSCAVKFCIFFHTSLCVFLTLYRECTTLLCPTS